MSCFFDYSSLFPQLCLMPDLCYEIHTILTDSENGRGHRYGDRFDVLVRPSVKPQVSTNDPDSQNMGSYKKNNKILTNKLDIVAFNVLEHPRNKVDPVSTLYKL